MIVQRTRNDQFDEAYGLLEQVGQWLQSLGRRQRVSRITRETYAAWQADECNYVVLDGHTIAGILTLRTEQLLDWPEVSGGVPFLRALATHPLYRGRGVGRAGVEFAIDKAAPDALYLDCVSDFLPDYYASVGFEPIGRRVIEEPDGRWDITLMRSGQADR